MTKPFTIYVMQSAHTDIGYTHPQEQLEAMYLEYYDRVLDLCRETAHVPEAHRFKWTCETFWQVRHYLSHRPERETEFLQYVRSGQIEITALYAHFTDLIDADAYRQSVSLAVEYCKRHNLPLRTAMHCDINGWPWAVADILADYHIPYFISHLNLDMGTDPLGRRGSLNYELFLGWSKFLRPGTPFRIPQAFWWKGPQGGSVLHWLSDQYLLGNVLGLSGAKGFHDEKTRYFTETDRDSVDDLYVLAQERVPLYIERLRAGGYPLDALLISTGGFFVDNAPPDTRWYQIIERWNREHDTIRLRTATVSEWFADLPTYSQETHPTYQVAWPDSWAHGLGSCTARVAQVRRSQRRMVDVKALIEQNHSARATAYLEKAAEQERMALEHTFGAWSTTRRPTSWLNNFEQNVKELFFHRSELYLNEAAGAALRSGTKTELRNPTLYAGSATRPDGTYSMHFTSEELHLDPDQQALRASDGQLHTFQRENDELAQFVAMVPLKSETLSSFELVNFPIAYNHPPRSDNPLWLSQVHPPRSGPPRQPQEIGAVRGTNEDQQESRRVDPRQPQEIGAVRGTNEDQQQSILQNGQGAGLMQVETAAWRLRINAENGSLRSLYELAADREWVNSEHEYGFGQLVHERVVHPWGWKAVGNEQRILALDIANEELKQSYPDVPVFKRSSPAIKGEPAITSGTIFDEIKFSSSVTEFGPVSLSWRFYHALPLIELVIDWDKPWSELPEAAYVTFPFAGEQAMLDLETGGGFFRPGSHETGGQLPGTCSSYYTMQRAARITGKDGAQGLWLPLDAPLVMTNELNFNRWETEPWTWNGFLASMPVNHYWHTNFPTSQRGPFRLRYRFVSQQAFANEAQSLEAVMPVEALGWH